MRRACAANARRPRSRLRDDEALLPVAGRAPAGDPAADCSMSTAAAAEAGAAAADPMPAAALPRARAVSATLADIATLELEAGRGGDLEFAPGQFNMLYASASARRRSASAATRRTAAVWCTRSARSARSAARIARLEPGDALGVRGPFGTGWPVAEADGQRRRCSSPAASAWRRCARRSITCWPTATRYGRVAMLYGARAPDDMLYRDELSSGAAARRRGRGHRRPRRRGLARHGRRRHQR